MDDLFRVYPTIPDGIRDIDKNHWANVETAYGKRDNTLLIKELLKLNLFPIKDSYVAFLKRDLSAIERNPQTVNRVCGRLYEMGLEKMFERCSEPKETNRQIGPMFRNWVNSKSLGIQPVALDVFTGSQENAILDGTDNEKKIFAKEHLNFHRDKGLDLVARFNKKYIIGEAKFLSDFGGSQNSDFEDAIATLEAKDSNAIRVAILDGVLYLEGRSKMYKFITSEYKNYNIMSSLVLRDFLYQV